MDKGPIQRSSDRLLLNAESFGFGPSAAIASIFPHLRERFEQISFAGSGHTLEMQTGLEYDKIHDLSDLKGPSRSRVIRELATDYDIFFTAMDFPILECFKAEGITTVGYDALAWYWTELPKGVKQSDLYLAQDFFNVRKRLAAHKQELAAYDIVPPIVPKPQARTERSHILINMGGLQNPFWSVDDAALYAKKVAVAARRILPKDAAIKITTSAAVAEKIGEQARVYSREQMREILAASRFAFMTPGLGNIYDAAIYDIPTIWLPPANDSQGQQLTMLKEHNMTDGSVSWDSPENSNNINYWDQQPRVLEEITRRTHQITIEELESQLDHQLAKMNENQTSKTISLIERFGTNGDLVVAERLHSFVLNNGDQKKGKQHA